MRLVTGENASGTVRFISPTASEQTRTYRVEIELDNHGAIPDGVTVEVVLSSRPCRPRGCRAPR